ITNAQLIGAGALSALFLSSFFSPPFKRNAEFESDGLTMCMLFLFFVFVFFWISQIWRRYVECVCHLVHGEER
ncbi:MAG: hypothetical protein ACK41O_26370, partial [Runella zeae]